MFAVLLTIALTLAQFSMVISKDTTRAVLHYPPAALIGEVCVESEGWLPAARDPDDLWPWWATSCWTPHPLLGVEEFRFWPGVVKARAWMTTEAGRLETGWVTVRPLTVNEEN